MLWRGFDGGQEVRSDIDDFFDRRRPTAARWSTAHERRRPSPSSTSAPEPYAVTPMLTARRADRGAVGDEPVHAIALRCQVRIEPQRRGYTDDEAPG